MKPPYRTAIVVAALVAIFSTQPIHAQIYTVLYTIEIPGQFDQVGPYAGVIEDAHGHFYGTTGAGGKAGNGTLFRLTLSPQKKVKVLYSFNAEGDGNGPAGLIREKNGTFFGNTYYGGAYGFGTIYMLGKHRKETLLHSFTSGADGAYPQSPLVEDGQGNLYGTTYSYGGASSGGTIFKYSSTGEFTTLYTFAGGADGYRPRAGVILDAEGNLYGTTAGGGANGVGAVFKLSNTGQETILYSFQRGTDGESPSAGVIRDSAGNLYGTTFNGGQSGFGTVFELNSAGQETILYSFTGRDGDGAYPAANVIRDPEGNLYGTTEYGGAFGAGTVFKVSKGGQETVLYSFTGLNDGGLPIAGLIQDAQGNLYGTTEYGGDLSCGTENSGCGVVFKVTP